MLNTTDRILRNGLGQHAFTDSDLAELFNKSAQSRYGLVNKAIKKGEIIRLRRGLYIIAEDYSQKRFSKFYLSSRIANHSYVSLESALAYHGWIPESVPEVYCVTNHSRTRLYETTLGAFQYYKLPINRFEFFTLVEHVTVEAQPFLMATPLRALADMIYVRKIDRADIDFLIGSLRIDEKLLKTISTRDIAAMRNVYNAKRVNLFLESLSNSL